MEYRILDQSHFREMVDLAQQLNPKLERSLIEKRQFEMFDYAHYTPFGCFLNGVLVGITAGWTTTRIYSGKQLELDNVVMVSSLRSQGLGKDFMAWIENWCREGGYESIELNSYADSPKAHKFYFNMGCRIAGFHFVKKLD